MQRLPLPDALVAQARSYADGGATPAEPRDAATVVLLRPGAAGPDVYLLRRQTSMAFAGGMCVFPGGGVDPRDFDDELVVAFLAEGPHHGGETTLNATLARVRATSQRPAWLVRMTGGTIGQEPSILLRFAPLLAVAALAGVIGGAMLVGALSPSPQPTAPPVVSPAASGEPTPSEASPEPTPTATGLNPSS